MSKNEVSVSIHQAARNIMAMPELPSLLDAAGVPYYGICRKLKYDGGCDEAYAVVGQYGGGQYGLYLPDPGHWTEQRLNIICLLAITEPQDWV